MGLGQRAADLPQDVHDARVGTGAEAGDEALEVDPLQVLHRVVEAPLLAAAVVVDRDGVRVGERGGHLTSRSKRSIAVVVRLGAATSARWGGAGARVAPDRPRPSAPSQLALEDVLAETAGLELGVTRPPPRPVGEHRRRHRARPPSAPAAPAARRRSAPAPRAARTPRSRPARRARRSRAPAARSRRRPPGRRGSRGRGPPPRPLAPRSPAARRPSGAARSAAPRTGSPGSGRRPDRGFATRSAESSSSGPISPARRRWWGNRLREIITPSASNA